MRVKNKIVLKKVLVPTYKSHHIFYLGLITTPKDQGQCGSCAAFASGSIIETCLKIAAGGKLNTYDISEQYLVDCAYQKPNKLEGPAGIILISIIL